MESCKQPFLASVYNWSFLGKRQFETVLTFRFQLQTETSMRTLLTKTSEVFKTSDVENGAFIFFSIYWTGALGAAGGGGGGRFDLAGFAGLAGLAALGALGGRGAFTVSVSSKLRCISFLKLNFIAALS